MSEATTLAFCGIDCGKCPVRIATSKNDEMLRQQTAKEWSHLYAEILESFGIHGLDAKDMNCFGCRSKSRWR